MGAGHIALAAKLGPGNCQSHKHSRKHSAPPHSHFPVGSALSLPPPLFLNAWWRKYTYRGAVKSGLLLLGGFSLQGSEIREKNPNGKAETALRRALFPGSFCASTVWVSPEGWAVFHVCVEHLQCILMPGAV